MKGFYVRLAVVGILALSVTVVSAQDIDSDVLLVMNLLGIDTPEALDENEVEQFSALLNSPVELNLATRAALVASGLFTQYQVASLMDYRQRHGDILSLGELASVDGFSEQFVLALSPFVALHSKASPGQSSIKELGVRNSLVTRAAYRTVDAESDYNYGMKYRLDIGGRFQLGVSVNRAYGTDDPIPESRSFYAAYYGRRKLGKVILGDFRLRYGQGLALWSGFKMESISSPESFYVRPSGISPYWSYTGSGSYRGVAADFNFGRFSLSGSLGLDGLREIMDGVSDKELKLMPAMNLGWYGKNAQVSVTGYCLTNPVYSDTDALTRTRSRVAGKIVRDDGDDGSGDDGDDGYAGWTEGQIPFPGDLSSDTDLPPWEDSYEDVSSGRVTVPGSRRSARFLAASRLASGRTASSPTGVAYRAAVHAALLRAAGLGDGVAGGSVARLTALRDDVAGGSVARLTALRDGVAGGNMARLTALRDANYRAVTRADAEAETATTDAAAPEVLTKAASDEADKDAVEDAGWSVDFRACIKGVDLFGEVAMDLMNVDVAALLGTVFKVSESVNIAVRTSYSDSERALSAAGRFSAGKSVKPSGGTVFGLTKRHSGTFGFEILHFPEPKYSDSGSDYQLKLQLNYTYQATSSFALATRVAQRFRSAGETSRTDVRCDLKYTRGDWNATLRLNALYNTDLAMLSYLEGGWKSGKMSVYLRAGIFRIDNWTDRIYVYERDAPGNFNVPAYYGRGVWGACTVGSKLRKWCKVYVRLSTLQYPWVSPTASTRSPKTEAKILVAIDLPD